MPYVEPETRARLTSNGPIETVGELTFLMQQAVQDYVLRHGLCYQTIAEVSGALHQAQRDFDQRVVEPYEAHKMVMNGDVWEPWLVNGSRARHFPAHVSLRADATDDDLDA